MTREHDRLIPVWFTVAALGLTGTVAVAVLVAVIASDGPTAAGGLVFAVALCGGFVAVCASLARRRRRVRLEPGPDGTVVIASPWLITAGLLVAWGGLLANCAIWARSAVGGGGLEVVGVSPVVLLGVVASLPDLARLLTGRLHRWRITLSDEGVGYRGYRTSVAVPWHEVRRVKIQRRRPAGVRVVGRHASFVAPATAFTVPSEQIVEEIRARSR